MFDADWEKLGNRPRSGPTPALTRILNTEGDKLHLRATILNTTTKTDSFVLVCRSTLVASNPYPAEVLPNPSLAQSLAGGQEIANALSSIRNQPVFDQIRDAVLGVHVEFVDPPLHRFLRNER